MGVFHFRHKKVHWAIAPDGLFLYIDWPFKAPYLSCGAVRLRVYTKNQNRKEITMGYRIQQVACKFFVEAKYADYVTYRLWQHSFVARYDAQGNIDSVWFRAEKPHNQLAMLRDIAPFVHEGSYIEMQGEDFKRWRWRFCDGECHKATAVFLRLKRRKERHHA